MQLVSTGIGIGQKNILKFRRCLSYRYFRALIHLTLHRKMVKGVIGNDGVSYPAYMIELRISPQFDLDPTFII
jgi:hypothetical protein